MSVVGLIAMAWCLAGAPAGEDAAALLAAGRLDEALAALPEAGEPVLRGKILLALGERDRDRGRLAEAEAALAQADPADAFALALLGAARSRLGETARDPDRRIYLAGAREAFARARELAEARANGPAAGRDDRKVLADVCLISGDAAAAAEQFIALLRAAVADTPGAWLQDVAAGLRNALDQQGGDALAGAAPNLAGLAAAIGARVPRLHLDLLDAHLAARNFVGAAAAARAALQDAAPDGGALPAPLRHALWSRLGFAEWLAASARSGPAALDGFVRAAEAYLEAVAIAPSPTEDDEAYQRAFSLAILLLSRGRVDAGQSILGRLRARLPAGPARARVGSSLGIQAAEAGDVDGARAAYAGALADLDAARASATDAFRAKLWGDAALVEFGAALRTPGDGFAAARRAFEASLAAAGPGDRYAVFSAENLARLAECEGKRDEARALLRRAIDAAAALPDPALRLLDTARVRTLVRWLD